MIPLVEFPELVRHYAPHFERVFSPAAFVQFQRYVSGLIVSENKTVEGINRLFVIESRNQSSLNRLLAESPFSLAELNQARLELLDSLPATRLKPYGVLSVDDTLLTHYGKHFDEIAKWYTQPGFCHHVGNQLGLAYVGGLAEDDQVILKTGHQRLDAFVARLKAEHLEALVERRPGVFKRITIHYKGERESYYSYCQTHRIESFGKVRLVINHGQEDLSDDPVFISAGLAQGQSLRQVMTPLLRAVCAA